MNNCEICRRIKMIEEGTNPHFVAELETGYVVIGDHQYFEGYTLFLSKKHVTELHYLQTDFKRKFLEEMCLVNEAVALAFDAEKMNCELLGNGDAHVHWHLFLRHKNDTPTPGPVWWLNRKIMFNENNCPTQEKLTQLRNKLSRELKLVLRKSI